MTRRKRLAEDRLPLSGPQKIRKASRGVVSGWPPGNPAARQPYHPTIF
jgi:hypothetical protein